MLIGAEALWPGKSQPSGTRMPCCRPARHQSRSNRSRPSGSIALRRSEEHTSELQSLMRISYAVFCLKKKKTQNYRILQQHTQSNQYTTYSQITQKTPGRI